MNGRDIEFSCEIESGGTFYCKTDKSGRLIRATEWFLTQMAHHLGIPTAECAVIDDPETGEQLFGSRQVLGAAGQAEAKAFLLTSRVDETGQPSAWPGAFLSGLYVFDLFVGNPDRSLHNFLLEQGGFSRRLVAFDFASAEVAALDGRKFPVATSPTVQIGRLLRDRHRFFPKSAFEMIDRIAAIPVETIESFLGSMPDDWMSRRQAEGICRLWSERRFGGRLAALRTGLADETLL